MPRQWIKTIIFSLLLIAILLLPPKLKIYTFFVSKVVLNIKKPATKSYTVKK
jgi:hypothetical protein